MPEIAVTVPVITRQTRSRKKTDLMFLIFIYPLLCSSFLSGTGKSGTEREKRGSDYLDDPFRRYMRAPSAASPKAASNPGDWAFVAAAAGGALAAVVTGTAVAPVVSGVNPVENSFMTPAVIETGAERSW
jgi:hypothetical protein